MNQIILNLQVLKEKTPPVAYYCMDAAYFSGGIKNKLRP